MPSRRTFATAFLATLALIGPGAGGVAAGSVPGTSLPLTGVSRMIVDGAHGHVFISGSASDSVLVVRNEDGTAAATITGESGAGGMVLDGSTLYVARCGWDVIDEIDTATLTKTGSIPAAVGGTCDLAEAGGRLWYSDSTDAQFGHLLSVSLDSSHTVVDSGLNLYEMMFATTPAHPDWLAVGESQQSPTVVYVEDVTDPANPVELTHVFNLGGGGNLQDMTVTPDGSTLLTAAGGPYEIDAFTLPGLTAAGVYSTDPYPNAVAVSPSGAKLAGGSMSYYDKDVMLFDAGNSTAAASWDFGSTSDLLYPRGLAFSSDGTSLLALSKGGTGSGVVLHVLPTVVLPAGSVTLSASAAHVLYGRSVTLTAHLGTATASRTLSIYRRPAAGGTPVLVTSGTAGPAGNFTATVRPSANTVYTAVWAGDGAHAATTSKGVTVKVRVVMHAPAQRGYASSGGYRLYHYAASCTGASHTGCPEFLAYASPLHPNRTLGFTVQIATPSGWHTLLTGSHATGSTGKLLLIIYYNSRAVVGVRQRIRFTMAGDIDHLGNTSPWTYYRVTT
jgi:hypothetical protein